MAEGFVLSESDVRVLRELVERERKRKPPSRPQDLQDDYNTPDVYIAKTPSGGIPALAPAAGTGTASGDYDRPGSAVCDIYHISGNNVDAEVRAIFSLTKRVYNLSDTPVSGSTWVIVVKEKSGRWLAAMTGAMTGGEGGGVPIKGGPGGAGCKLASLRDIDCVLVNDSGDDVVLKKNGGSTWTGTNGRGDWAFGWDSAVGISYLTLNGLRLMNCGNGCFSGGALTGHLTQVPAGTGTAPSNGTIVGCTGEEFTVCLSCHCCVSTMWHGEGWYCIDVGVYAGTGSSDCEAAYLTERDKCFPICSGPFASQAEALAWCPSGCTAAQDGPTTDRLLATVTAATGVFAGALGRSFYLYYIGVDTGLLPVWYGSTPFGSCCGPLLLRACGASAAFRTAAAPDGSMTLADSASRFKDSGGINCSLSDLTSSQSLAITNEGGGFSAGPPRVWTVKFKFPNSGTVGEATDVADFCGPRDNTSLTVSRCTIVVVEAPLP